MTKIDNTTSNAVTVYLKESSVKASQQNVQLLMLTQLTSFQIK